MTINQIKEILREAIDQHLSVNIRYVNDTTDRVFNPYHYGICGGKEQLQAYQTSGPSKSGNPVGWKNLKLSEVINLDLAGSRFTPPDTDRRGNSYNPNDPKYTQIDHQIKYDGMNKSSKLKK